MLTSITLRISYFHSQVQDVLDGNSIMSLLVNIRIRFRKVKWESVQSTICHQEGRNPLAHHKRYEEDLEVDAWDPPIQRQSRDCQYRLLQNESEQRTDHVHESKEKVNKLGCDNANYKLGWVFPSIPFSLLYLLSLYFALGSKRKRKRERERDRDRDRDN